MWASAAAVTATSPRQGGRTRRCPGRDLEHQGFVARWFRPAPAASSIVESDLQPAGTDRLSGTITNRLPVAIDRHDRGLWQAGVFQRRSDRAGATIDIEKFLDRSLANAPREKLQSFVHG